MNYVMCAFGWIYIAFLLGKYVEMEFLANRVDTCLTLDYMIQIIFQRDFTKLHSTSTVEEFQLLCLQIKIVFLCLLNFGIYGVV